MTEDNRRKRSPAICVSYFTFLPSAFEFESVSVAQTEKGLTVTARVSESPSCFEQALCLHTFDMLLACSLLPLVLLIPRSLMNSIVREEGFLTRGAPEEVSTVGIDLLRHRLRGIKVEFYDCAGQLDYAGMHDTFLSRRGYRRHVQQPGA